MSGTVELYGIEYKPATAPWDHIAKLIQANAEESLRELEESVRVKYRTDALFHARVKLGARILDQIIPDLDPRDAMRAALLVLAAGLQEPV